MNSSPQLAAGTRLGPYQIVEPLGAGGMGEVFRARDPRLERDVAVKVLPENFAQDSDRLRRFREEALVASRLNHPNIVHVYDIGEQAIEGGRTLRYVAMELVAGSTFAAQIQDGPLSWDRLKPLAGQLLEGLAKAHSAGIVHRDLKPENIMVTSDGYVKILDFGLAKRLPIDEDLSGLGTRVGTPTMPGMAVGTLGYMSPEQARGQSADHRSDQFAFGVVLYEMASGEQPFRRESPAESLVALISEAPIPLEDKTRFVPPAVCRLALRCLSKLPEERYQTTDELLADFLESASESIEAGSMEALSVKAGSTGAGSSGTSEPDPISDLEALSTPRIPTAKTSIAILPVQLLSNSDLGVTLASGLAGEISDALTRIGGVRVVSRLPAALASSEHADFVGIAQQFGTDYVLFMSLNHVGERIRVKAELHRAPEGFMCWTTRSDVELGEVFTLQQSIAEAVADELGGELFRSEYLRIREQQITNLDTWSLTQHSANLVISGENFPAWDEALELARRALELDPGFGPAWARLAALLGERAAFLLAEDMSADIEEALAAAERGVRLSPYDPYVLMNCGQAWTLCGKVQQGRSALAKAVELIPHDSLVWLFYCFAKALNGDEGGLQEVLEIADRLRAQSPRNPLAPHFLYLESIAEFRLGRFQRIVDRYHDLCLSRPQDAAGGIWVLVASSLGELDRCDEAVAVFETISDRGYCRKPEDIAPTYERLAGSVDKGAVFLRGLRKAKILPGA